MIFLTAEQYLIWKKHSGVDVFDAEIAYVMHEAKMLVFWIQLTKNAVL